MIVKYDDTQVDHATVMEVNKKTMGDGTASFLLPSFENANLATWQARAYHTIQFFEGDDLIFEGFIRSVYQIENTVNIFIMEFSAELEWNYLSPEQSNFVIDEGIITEVVDTTITCTTNEGENPDWTGGAFASDAYVKTYVIISDTDDTENTDVMENGTNGYVGYGGATDMVGASSGDYTDVDNCDLPSEATSYWSQWMSGLVSYGTLRIDLGIENDSIAANVDLLRARIKAGFEITTAGAYIPANYLIILRLSQAPTSGGTKTTIAQQSIAGSGLTTYSKYFDEGIEFDNVGNYFTVGDPNYTGGFLFLEVFLNWATTTSGDVLLKWKNLSYEIDYQSQPFEVINNRVSYNSDEDLRAIDDDDDLIDFGDLNVAAGDTFVLCKDALVAFATVGNGEIGEVFAYPVYVSTTLGYGVYWGFGKKYNGINSKQLFDQLMTNRDLMWMTNYSQNPPYISVYRRDLDEIPSNGSTLSDMKSAPITYPQKTYRRVVIYWAESYAISHPDLGDPDSKQILPDIRSDIRDQTTAQQEADKKAESYNGGDSAEITCNWDKYVALQCGYKQSLLIRGTTYTDLIIKSVKYSQQSANDKCLTEAVLGGIQEE